VFQNLEFNSKIVGEKILFCSLKFGSAHFWFLVTFGDEVMKLRKYNVIVVYILQGKMGKTEQKTE